MGALNFVYDKSNQPTQLTGSSSGTYTYDGKFKRVKVDVDGKVIYNVFDASGALVHVDKVSGGTTNIPVCFTDCSTVAVSGPQTIDYIKTGSLSIRLENDEPTYLHNDLLGSPVAGTDKFGNVIWQEQYTPYGEKILNSAANDDLGSFTGHIDDSSTGLTYMQARYYDPVIGRFLSNDPIGFLGHLGGVQGVQGFNRYAYVNNNPYKYTDPDGKAACGGICVGAVVIFIGKEIAGEVFEQTTGVPAPTVKNLGKAAAKKYISRRLRRTESAKDIKSRTGQRNGGDCEFCGNNQATATDHLETSVSEVADAVIEGEMSFDEADAAANNEGNAADSCTSCNSSKGTKKVGRGFKAKKLSNRLAEKLKDKLE